MGSKLRQHSVSTVRKLQELVHDVNLQVASYRYSLQMIGTPADSAALRRELEACRRQCLKACDSTKNSVLPQLKSETHEALQSSEFTKQASQFIGCVAAFVIEMRRYQALISTFPHSYDGEERVDAQLHANLSRDIGDAEAMLETLENLITVHFSTKDEPGDKVEPPRRGGSRSCPLDCICSNFKTSYA